MIQIESESGRAQAALLQGIPCQARAPFPPRLRFIEATGAQTSPWPEDGPLRSLNLSGAERAAGEVAGRILVGTRRERDGERVAGRLRLRLWEGVVVAEGTLGG